MWHYSYTKGWFEAIIQNLENSNIPLDRTYFVMVLMRDINIEIKNFIYNYYEDLHRSSGLALQIFAPIKPPESISKTLGPEDPFENSEELISFYDSLTKMGIRIDDLPKIIFFNLRKINENRYEFENIKSLSLKTMEFRGSRISYHEFFSELENLAYDCYIKNKSPQDLYSRIYSHFQPIIWEERILGIPILGRIYEKRIG